MADTDRELLEMAARAAGGISSDGLGRCYDMEREAEWNPLADDGDAMRLAVKCSISPTWYDQDNQMHRVHGSCEGPALAEGASLSPRQSGWPFPLALTPARPPGGIPFNPDNYEESPL